MNNITVLGVPLDHNSSYKRGASSAPAKIREALYCDSSNLWTEDLRDLGASPGWQMGPDLDLLDEESALNLIEAEVEQLLQKDSHVIGLGGDHSITLPIIRAYTRLYPQLNVLHFDAHPDLYHELDGNQYSHACPFARIMEEKLVVRLVQVGIRTMTGHQKEQVDRFGVEVITMKDIGRVRGLSFDGPVYLSIDLDCLDPAFAPGVSHHEPGGLSTRAVLEIIQGLKGVVVGADIVEYNPDRDNNGVTGMVAAKLLKELLAKMLA
ncbi:MAG: agmatinase [Desulfobulbaceae bacterium]|nr:MAG: agmatinase [Desulfobulbaceae bacterium]